jgi:hypothetical protein
MEITQKHAAAFKGIPSDPAGVRLPARLFKLRKRIEFLTRTGLAGTPLDKRCDAIAQLISKGKYAPAAEALTEVESTVKDMDAKITSETIAVAFPSRTVKASAGRTGRDGIFPVTRVDKLCLRFDESIAAKLRKHNFDGFLEFEYLNIGKAAFEVVTSPARPDVKGPRHYANLYSEVCRIKKDATRKWVPAKVKVFKVNTAFDHGAANKSDFVFQGNVRVRNIRFTFEVFRADQ